MKTFISLLILLYCAGNTVAQNTYSGEEMNFWIGEWDLTWTAKNGEPGKGVNKIEKILNGAVILENFKGIEGSFNGYMGKSFTVYNKQQDKWFQTWVDSQGGYLPFEFELEGDNRIFKRKVVDQEGKVFWTRMIFYNIEKNNFKWDWQRSKDNKNWITNWSIHYSRKFP